MFCFWENVTSGHGIIDKSEEFEAIYKTIEDGVFKAIVNNLDIFIQQVKTNIGKGDKDIDDDDCEIGNIPQKKKATPL